MTKTSSEVQQQGDKIIKTTTTEGEGRVSWTSRDSILILLILLVPSYHNINNATTKENVAVREIPSTRSTEFIAKVSINSPTSVWWLKVNIERSEKKVRSDAKWIINWLIR